MIKFLFSTWGGGVLLGAWVAGFILAAEKYTIFSTKGKYADKVIGDWLAALFWPIPVVWGWVSKLFKK